MPRFSDVSTIKFKESQRQTYIKHKTFQYFELYAFKFFFKKSTSQTFSSLNGKT